MLYCSVKNVVRQIKQQKSIMVGHVGKAGLDSTVYLILKGEEAMLYSFTYKYSPQWITIIITVK